MEVMSELGSEFKSEFTRNKERGTSVPERRDSLGKGSEVGGSMVCVSGSICFRSGSASRPWAERLHSAVGSHVGHGLVKYLGTRSWV